MAMNRLGTFLGLVVILMSIQNAVCQSDRLKIPDNFETLLRAGLGWSGEMAELRLAYDKSAGLGAIVRRQSGKVERLIYDLNAGKFVNYTETPNNTTCSYSRIKDEQETFPGSIIFFPFFVDLTTNDVKSDMSGREVLKIPDNIVFSKENSSLGGGKLSSWNAVLKTHVPVLTCNLTYQFEEPTQGFTKPLIILEKCERVGKGIDERELDFYEFTAPVSDRTIFQLPPGTVCHAKPKGRDLWELKTLPSVWSVRREIIETRGQIRIKMEEAVWYDGKRLLTRIDHEEIPEMEADAYSKIDYTTINDYIHGVTYEIKNEGESCKILTLGDSMIPKPEAVLLDIGEHTQTSNQEIGKRPCRGKECEVWAIEMPSTSMISKSFKAVQDVYFLKKKIPQSDDLTKLADFYTPVMSEKVEKFPNENGTLVPMYQRKTNFYHYQVVSPDVDVFDVSSCFHPADKTNIFLTIQGPHGTLTQDAKLAFRQALFDILNDVMELKSSVRLNRLKISDPDGDKSEVSVILVEDPHRMDTKLDEDAEPDIPSKEALDTLKRKIAEGGGLKLTFKGDEDDKAKGFIINNLRTEGVLDSAALKQKKPDWGKYTGMDLLGAVIGTMFLGIVIAIVSLFACYRFRKDLVFTVLRAK